MTTARAVLDTNFLYYLAGVSTESRLRTDWVSLLEKTHSLALASPTIIEVLTRKGFELDDLWICLDVMFSGRICDIIQIGYLPFDVDTLGAVVGARDIQGLG